MPFSTLCLVCRYTNHTTTIKWHSQGPPLEPRGGPKSGPCECIFVLSVSSVDTRTIPRLVSGIPQVHFWNLPAGRFHKWTLRMPLGTFCVVCRYTNHTATTKWHSRRFQKWTLGMTRSSRGMVLASTDDTESTKWHYQCPLLEPGGSKSGHWECHVVLSATTRWHSQGPLFGTWSHRWNLGMPLSTRRIVCRYTNHTTTTKWTL